MTSRPSLEQLQGATAGFITRLLAYVIDVAIITAMIVVGGWLSVLLDDLLTEEIGVELRFSAAGIFALLTPAIIGAYFVVMWSLTGKTVGKQLLGLKVVRSDGRPPSIGRSILRYIGYGLSAIVFFAGYFWIIIDDQRRGWHDHIARTWVVYDWEKRRRGQVYEAMIEDHTTSPPE